MRLGVAAVLLLVALAGCFGGGGKGDGAGASGSLSASGAPATSGGATLSFTYAPLVPLVGQAVNFSGTVKGLGDRTVEAWGWSWGDGSANATGSPATHTFAKPGEHPVRLNALLSDGRTLGVTQRVLVLNTPGSGDGNATANAPPPPPPGEFSCGGATVVEPHETYGTDDSLPSLAWATLKTGFRFAVVWTSESPSVGTLEYTLGNGTTQSFTEPVATRLHVIVLNSLSENRTLCFTVTDGARTTPMHAVRTVNAMTSFQEGSPHGAYTMNSLILVNEQGDLASVEAAVDGYAALLWDATDGWVRSGANLIVVNDPLHHNLGYFGCGLAVALPSPLCTQWFDVLFTNNADPRGAASTYRQGVRDPMAAVWMNQYHQATPGPFDLDDADAVLLHEYGHYVFDMDDLYGDNTVITSECYDASSGISIMAGSREATEFDDPATPCPNQPGGYTTSWELAQGQFDRLPDRPTGPLEGPDGDGGTHLRRTYRFL